MNPANMNPGFGMDPNLLTPSYTAGYRPQYAGPQPYNQYGRVGFFAGINSVLNPMAPDYRFGNPIDNQRQSVEGVSSRPFDSVVWAGQRIVAPTLAFGAAFKFAGGPGSALGRGIGQGFARGMSAGMGGYMPNFVYRGLSGALGKVGGLAGGLLVPMAVGQAAMAAGQAAFFDPYINSRREARDMRDNFAGVTFGDASGNSVTGQGLGFRESSRIASDITTQGIRDLTFSSGEYSNISDYSARAGLMDDVGSKQIAKRVKDVAAQIKLVMAIAGDPSIKNAIEELAKLRNAGASITGPNSQATSALTQLGYSASVAGRSVQNIMATVGAQGQYLYQANGMTPYLGQMAAANILGSFETARRTGLLTTAQVARMGGTEGATQASLTAQINGSQTLLNKMALYNQYLGGHGGASINGGSMNVNSVVGQFGSDFSKDPLGAYGKMMMFSRMLGGKQLQERGSLALEDQVYSILNNTAATRNKDGRYDASQMMPVLTNMMGMSEDDAMAYISQRTSESDPATYRQAVRARNAQAQKQMRQYVNTNYLYGGAMGSTVRGIRNTTNNIVASLSRSANAIVEGQGIFGDAVNSGFDSFVYGSTLGSGSMGDNAIDAATFGAKNVNTAPTTVKQINGDSSRSYYDWGRMGKDLGRLGSSMVNAGVMAPADNRRVIQRINQLARSGHPEAQAFINATDKNSKRAALSKLLDTPDMADMKGLVNGGGASDQARGNTDALIDDVMGFGTVDKTSGGPQTGLMGQVNGVLGMGDKTVKMGLMDSINAIGQVSDLANKINGGMSSTDIDALISGGGYDQVKTLLGGRTGKDAGDYIVHSYRNAVSTGLAQAGYVAFNGGFSVDEFKKNPDRIRDPKVRAAFVAAMKSGDNATMENIVGKSLKDHNGGSLTSTGLKGAQSLSLGDVAGFQQQMDELGMQNTKEYDLVRSGRFDFATTQNLINGFDQKKNNKDFATAVDKLDKAAQKIIDDKDSPSSGSGGGWSLLNPFNGTSNVRPPNNQRDAGSPQNR